MRSRVRYTNEEGHEERDNNGEDYEQHIGNESSNAVRVVKSTPLKAHAKVSQFIRGDRF